MKQSRVIFRLLLDKGLPFGNPFLPLLHSPQSIGGFLSPTLGFFCSQAIDPDEGGARVHRYDDVVETIFNARRLAVAPSTQEVLGLPIIGRGIFQNDAEPAGRQVVPASPMHPVGVVNRGPFNAVCLPLRLCLKLGLGRLVSCLVFCFVDGKAQSLSVDDDVDALLGVGCLLSPGFQVFVRSFR